MGSQWSSKTNSCCILRSCSPNLIAVANFFAIGNLCVPMIAIPSLMSMNFSLVLKESLYLKSLEFLHYPLFLNLELMAAFLHLLLLHPLRAGKSKLFFFFLRPDSKFFRLCEPYSLCHNSTAVRV